MPHSLLRTSKLYAINPPLSRPEAYKRTVNFRKESSRKHSKTCPNMSRFSSASPPPSLCGELLYMEKSPVVHLHLPLICSSPLEKQPVVIESPLKPARQHTTCSFQQMDVTPHLPSLLCSGETLDSSDPWPWQKPRAGFVWQWKVNWTLPKKGAHQHKVGVSCTRNKKKKDSLVDTQGELITTGITVWGSSEPLSKSSRHFQGGASEMWMRTFQEPGVYI